MLQIQTTHLLVNAGATVLAIEKDPYMVALVRERFTGADNVKVLEEDFTRFDLRHHMSSIFPSKSHHDGSSSSAKVVANIPFNISTHVVKQLLPMGDIFMEVVLLLQDELALRLVDSSLKSSEYRPINVFVNFYSGCPAAHSVNPNYMKVSRTSFFPQPKVNSDIEAALRATGLLATITHGCSIVADFIEWGWWAVFTRSVFSVDGEANLKHGGDNYNGIVVQCQIQKPFKCSEC